MTKPISLEKTLRPSQSQSLGVREAESWHGPTKLRLRLIGQMSASDENGIVALPRVRKTRAVLAILALAAPRPVLRNQITALLWSTRESEQARASLRQSVHELQDMCVTIGLPLLRTGRQHLQLDIDQVWVDVHAIAHATSAQADLLDLVQGGVLEDLTGLDPAFDQWLATETRTVHTTAGNLAALVLEQQSEPAKIIAAARRLVAISPTHEAGWRRLMQAYGDAGERAAAIEAFEQCVQSLSLIARTQPSNETMTLATAIRDGTANAAPVVAAVPPGTSPHIPHNGSGRGSRRGVWLGVAAFRATDPQDEATVSVGLAEEITTALARFRWINLIAPGSIAALAHEPTGQTERWRALDLDFLLDGTIQRSGGMLDGGQIRVTVRLIDMREGCEVIWSRRFDRAAAGLFTLQDEIAAETAAQVDPELIMHESKRIAARPMQDPTAYELMLRAIPAIYRLVEPAYSEAGRMLALAAERAPDSATLHAWWACWYAFLVGQGWAADPEAAIQKAGSLAERAVALDPACARALSIAGYVRGFVLHRDIAETIALHERALVLNPNMPFAWAVSALAHTYAGDHETAVAYALQARRLSPFDPHGFFFDNALMVPSLLLGDFDTVVAAGRRSLGLNPAMSSTCKGLLSALGHLGRPDEAKAVLAQLLQIEPRFTLASAAARSPLRREADRATYLDGLRLAGLR